MKLYNFISNEYLPLMMMPNNGNVTRPSLLDTNENIHSFPPTMAPDARENKRSSMDQASEVITGPDLNVSRAPVDKKLYRQILLPNGLRCVLIQDTAAMQQGAMTMGSYDMSDEESMEESDNQSKEDESTEGGGGGAYRDAAAAVLVGAGSMYDPPHCQGLAHFLEHLLFMGSEKYPGENEYESFIAKHGGSDNAFTEWEYTVYSFDIPQEFLWPALERLAQFFIAPLMLESAVERELLSIESEFQLHKNSDSCRWQQLLCATSEPNHPMAKFSWGNLKSLKEIPEQLSVDTMKELWTFYHQYYYAANMRLAVIGAYSLDDMEKKVAEMFSGVPSLPRQSAPFPLPVDPDCIRSWDCEYNSPIAQYGFPLQDKGLRKVFRIVPVKQKHSIIVTWPIPSQMDAWRSKPVDFISHLMGHEASGSLLSYFRSKSWATSCTVGVGEEGSERASSHALFVASFVLSRAGIDNWTEVVDAIYQYIGMLRLYCRRGWPEWIFEEIRSVCEMSYQFGDDHPPDETVESIVEGMAPHLKMPPERLLDGSSLLFEFDPDAVQEILEKWLTPRNSRIDITSSEYSLSSKSEDDGDGDQKGNPSPRSAGSKVVHGETKFDLDPGTSLLEPMFGTDFWCQEMSEELIERWEELAIPQEPSIGIQLPPQNPFVPTNLSIKRLPEDDAAHPLLNASLKICAVVGKKKQWFPATVLRFNAKTNSVLMSYEDGTEHWHAMDLSVDEFTPDVLLPHFEGWMDKKSRKFKVIALGTPGKGAKLVYGDESDFDVEDGKHFPPLPPPLPASRLPKQVCNSNSLKMWWLQDRNYARPIAELRAQIVCRRANATPLHRTCADLLEVLCNDALIEVAYLAEMCEIFAAFDATDDGFAIRVHGFDDKLLELLRAAIDVFLSFRGCSTALPGVVKEGRFPACIEILERRYKNAGLQASSLSSSLRLQALRPTVWSSNKKLSSLKLVDENVFCSTISEILQEMAMECLLHGNITYQEAGYAKELILALINSSGGEGLPRKYYPPQSVLKIPDVSSVNVITVPSKDTNDSNTAVELYIQVGKDDLRERVLIDTLVHIMDEPMFDQIRTKDQFGYDVSCDVRWTFGIMGMIFRIVTNVKSALESLRRIDNFLSEFRETLVLMSDSEFLEHCVGLAQQKLDMFNSLSEETDHLWSEIRDGRFQWQSWRDEAQCLRSVTKEDVISSFDAWLNPDSKRRVMAVQVIGAGETDSAMDRPMLESGDPGDFYDAAVEAFHKVCKQQQWGRVNSKLF